MLLALIMGEEAVVKPAGTILLLLLLLLSSTITVVGTAPAHALCIAGSSCTQGIATVTGVVVVVAPTVVITELSLASGHRYLLLWSRGLVLLLHSKGRVYID